MSENKDYRLFKIAYSYYIDKMTQDQISKMYGISRSNVSMMLNEARNKGIIEIKVNFPEMYKHDLEEELSKKYNLKKAIVISDYYESEKERMEFLANAAVEYLDKKIEDNMTIGVSWGKSVYEVASKIEYNNKSNLVIAPIVGGIGTEVNKYHSNVIASRMADRLKATALGLYAPVFIESEVAKNMLFEDKNIKDVMNIGRKSDIAIVGIGNLENSTMLELKTIEREQLDMLSGLGAVGDINTSFISLDGSEVESDFKNKTMNLSLEDLKKIPTVVAISGGVEKTESIRAALKGGILDVLVTDEQVANRLVIEK